MEGWIKISRGITEHWLWQDAERLKWWIDMCFRAASEEKKVTHDGHEFTLHCGEIIASPAFLAKEWNRDRKTIISFLKSLEAEGMIIRKVLNRHTAVITICNYERYQYSDNNATETLENCSSKKEENEGVVSKIDGRKIDAEKFMNFFNDTLDKYNSIIPRIRSLSGKRFRALKARSREYGKKEIGNAVIKAAQSNFLNGGGERGFVASFDWIYRPDNFLQVLEGSYDNHGVIATSQNRRYMTNYERQKLEQEQRRRDAEALIARIRAEDPTYSK